MNVNIPEPISSEDLKKNIFLDVYILVCALFIIGCAPTSTPRVDDPQTNDTPIIQIVGSTAVEPLLEELTTAYRANHLDSAFEIHSGGSRLGEAQVFGGEADLALSTLFTRPSELFPATETISETDTVITTELVRTPIALSGLAIIVHAENPLADLSVEQLQRLYSGRITTWADLGADLGIEQPPGEVQLVSRENESGARLLFDERIMRGERLSLTALIAPTNDAIIQMVGANGSAIGYVDQAFVRPSNATPQVRVVAVDGALPDEDAIASQTYPLVYPLYLVASAEQTTNVDAFVTWLNSEQGQEIIGQFHVLPR